MAATEDVQSLDQSADIFIYEITNYNSSNPKEKARFSNYSGVSFGGSTVGLAITHDAIETTSVGAQPRISLSISDTGGFVTSMIDGNTDGLEGAVVKILRTKKKYLDSEPLGGNPSIGILQQTTLVVSRIEDFVPLSVVTISLQSPIDYGNISCPSRSATQKCNWQYRGSYCTYQGSAMFKLDNSPTLNPDEDVCSKTLDGCRARFPGQVLPTSAFPTLQRR